VKARQKRDRRQQIRACPERSRGNRSQETGACRRNSDARYGLDPALPGEPIVQNKPNLREGQMSVTLWLARSYQNMPRQRGERNKANSNLSCLSRLSRAKSRGARPRGAASSGANHGQPPAYRWGLKKQTQFAERPNPCLSFLRRQESTVVHRSGFRNECGMTGG
jgi:hypothetical protein